MKQCEKCGHEIVEGAAFCVNCGVPVSAINESKGPMVQGMNSEASAPFGPAMNMPMGQSMDQPMGPMSQPMNGQAIPQPMMSSTSEDSPKKKLDGKMIAILACGGVCLLIGIIGIVLAVVTMTSKKDDSQIAVNTTDGGSTVDAVSSGTKVSYAGYEFAIPKGYDYEIAEEDGVEALLTSNSDDYVALTVYSDDVTFARIESNIGNLEEQLSSQFGHTVTSRTETIEGVKFLCLDVGLVEGVNAMYAISEADLYYFQTTILTTSDSNPSQYLENVAKVVGSAQKKKSNRSLGSDMFSNLKTFNISNSLKEDN